MKNSAVEYTDSTTKTGIAKRSVFSLIEERKNGKIWISLRQMPGFVARIVKNGKIGLVIIWIITEKSKHSTNKI